MDGCIIKAPGGGQCAFNRLQRCYERREDVIDAFFDLADTIITVRSLIRRVSPTVRAAGQGIMCSQLPSGSDRGPLSYDIEDSSTRVADL